MILDRGFARAAKPDSISHCKNKSNVRYAERVTLATLKQQNALHVVKANMATGLVLRQRPIVLTVLKDVTAPSLVRPGARHVSLATRGSI